MSNDVENAIHCVAENEVSAVSLARQLLGEGKEKVIVELKREKTMPQRMESPARAHVFHDVAGFTTFVKANKSQHTIIFADVDDVVIFAVLDDRAQKGFEAVELRPPYHPEFTLLNDSLLNQSLPIELFAQGVMRNRKVIRDTDACDGKSLALSMQQLTVATAIVQAIGDGKTSVNGVMTTTTVKTGAPEAKEHLDLPDSISVELPIYLNTDKVKFDLDIIPACFK